MRRQPAGQRTAAGVGPPHGWSWWDNAATAGAVVLAIDTSTRTGGVALVRGDEVLGEDTWQAGGSQTAQVLPAAERLWRRAGLTPSSMSAVIVATGPGSFTGLRVGLSVGKGLSVALGIPLYGFPTLDAVAYQHRSHRGPLIAVIDAGRGQRYVGWYDATPQRLRRASDFGVLSTDELIGTVAAQTRTPLVAGEVSGDDARKLVEQLGDQVRIATPATALRRTGYLGEVGRWLLGTQAPSEPATLQPIYLKRTGS